MATKEAIAIIRDTAVMALKESGQQIADMLGVEPPNIGFVYRDKDYQQAEELRGLAEFNKRILTALEGRDDDTTTETAQPKSKR